ncbi:hypothetical protein ACXUPC_30175 [Pseudomonas marginalis]|jgi:Ca2+-binding RTX toxin-like protein|uniref:calcium-binding protein n=1 Tax=Pseudomonas marginalis TaxID=298 RepID=UPI0038B5C621
MLRLNIKAATPIFIAALIVLSVATLIISLHKETYDDATIIESIPYTISRPGNYRLDRSLNSDRNGIEILASNVTIDLNQNTITGPTDGDNTGFGIFSFGQSNITIKNGRIRGFQYGVYLSGLSDLATHSSMLEGRDHLVEGMNIRFSTFRGIRVEGENSVISDNMVSDIGGDTTTDNAYAMGIETYGKEILIQNNSIMEVRGQGIQDISEGVGISLSRYGEGSVVDNNRVANRELEISSTSPAWKSRSRSTYGIWVGGDGIRDVVISNNRVNNFKQGITFKRSESGSFLGNRVTNAFIPYYLPDNHDRTRVADLGQNTSDEETLDLKPGRATPGQIETVEPPYLTYLSPLHRRSNPAFLPRPNPSNGDDIIIGIGERNMVDYWSPIDPSKPDNPVFIDLAAGRASGGGGNDRLINIRGAQGSPYNDVILGDAHDNLLAGGGGNDRIEGGEGNDYLYGDDGDDELFGGPGDDVLDGGEGNDILWGGPGADTFIFWKGSGGGETIIGDFSGSAGEQDRIDLAGILATFEDVLDASVEVGDDLLITLNADDSILLLNIKKEELTPADFSF